MSVNNTKPSRRQFLGTAGLVGAGAILASCAPATAATPGKANLDAAIGNFALNLEYLEAAFYLAAVGRLGELDAAGGNSAMVSFNTNALVNAKNGIGTITDPDLKSIVNEIATDEVNHVKALRGILKGGAVAQPQLNLGTAFQVAGSAASGGAITGFDPYANDLFFLHGAFIFEDVGVTAYKGAARLITDDSAGGILESAAGILAVEAYHAGYVRTILYQQRAVKPAGAAGLSVAQIVAAISNLRAGASKGADGNADGKDQGITSDGTATGAANLVPTDANSIAFSRTTSEVLAIAYLGDKSKPGGFFPNGLNGAIK